MNNYLWRREKGRKMVRRFTHFMSLPCCDDDDDHVCFTATFDVVSMPTKA